MPFNLRYLVHPPYYAVEDQGCRSATACFRPKASAHWKDSQVPPLSMCTSLSELKNMCLLIAVFDYDRMSPNDPLGVVTIPLGAPVKLRPGATSYVIDVDQPIGSISLNRSGCA